MITQQTDDSQNGGDLVFKPSRIVVMSELSSSEREPYYNLILANNVKLQYSDNQFVANVRLLGPTGDAYEVNRDDSDVAPIIGREAIPTTPGRKSNNGLPLEKRMHRLHLGASNKQLSFQINGVAMFDYGIFSRFCSLIGNEIYCNLKLELFNNFFHHRDLIRIEQIVFMRLLLLLTSSILHYLLFISVVR